MMKASNLNRRASLLPAVVLGIFFTALGLASAPSLAAGQTPVIKARSDLAIERPAGLFTQGLLFHEGSLFESAGLYGQSAVYRWPRPDKAGLLKAPLAAAKLPSELFAEGLAALSGKLYLLTWREGVVIALDPSTLGVLETFFAPGEGWGLAAIGGDLWSSDGSSLLTLRDLGTLARKEGRQIAVHDDQGPVENLNELEFDPKSGLILANIWQSDLVAAIDPENGQVRYYLDLSELARKERADSSRPDDAVANGLAIDEDGRLWITGKYWTRLYRLAFETIDLP
ncbi:MAG: glutaminyl-peptide cyclotransferase [Deltaproteobacteria bacterium]|jgi:glutamine cyclotransferase|nr:glutaminyl-peptide cyclotransferase [Deltaproteobacteria bacterium]